MLIYLTLITTSCMKKTELQGVVGKENSLLEIRSDDTSFELSTSGKISSCENVVMNVGNDNKNIRQIFIKLVENELY